ncbi:MAG: ribokinase [Propionibacteriaceae bacterium]|jgi:ribokinase|nr:ribokinase [Propionibacteriaceae bacterium]
MSAVRSGGIVVVGSVNVDLTVRVDRRPAAGETVPGRSLAVTAGGKGANQALAAARLGGHVTLVGAVGRDAHADVALDLLRSAGADLNPVTPVDDSTGVAVIVVDGGGDNSIMVVPGANGRVGAAAVAVARAAIAGADVVILQMEIPRDGVEAAAAACRGRLIFNLAPAGAIDSAVLRLADPLVVNEHEAAAAVSLLAGGPPTVSALAPGTEADCAAQLLAAGVPSVVLTMGSRGAVIAPGQGRPVEALPAIPVTAVDTTGAGDAFVGALAVSLAAGQTLGAAARYATRVAAYSVQRAGAQPSYPGRDDVLPVLEESL